MCPGGLGAAVRVPDGGRLPRPAPGGRHLLRERRGDSLSTVPEGVRIQGRPPLAARAARSGPNVRRRAPHRHAVRESEGHGSDESAWGPR